MLRPHIGQGLPGIALALTLCGADSPVLAEPADSTRAPSSGAVITEVGIHTAISKSRDAVDAVYASIDVGYLHRTGERTMVGAGLSFSFHDDGSFWAIQPRLRRELDRNWGLDVAAGPVVAGNADGYGLNGLGVSAIADLHFRGFVGVTLGFDSVKYSSTGGAYYGEPGVYDGYAGGSVTSTHIGLRVGKGPGITAAVVLGILAIAAVSSIAN